MKKRLFSILSAAVLASTLLGSSLGVSAQETPAVGSLKGPTSMGLVKLMSDQESADSPEFSFPHNHQKHSHRIPALPE